MSTAEPCSCNSTDPARCVFAQVIPMPPPYRCPCSCHEDRESSIARALAAASTAIQAKTGAAADEACALLAPIPDPAGAFDTLLMMLEDRAWPEAQRALDKITTNEEG